MLGELRYCVAELEDLGISRAKRHSILFGVPRSRGSPGVIDRCSQGNRLHCSLWRLTPDGDTLCLDGIVDREVDVDRMEATRKCLVIITFAFSLSSINTPS